MKFTTLKRVIINKATTGGAAPSYLAVGGVAWHESLLWAMESEQKWQELPQGHEKLAHSSAFSACSLPGLLPTGRSLGSWTALCSRDVFLHHSVWSELECNRTEKYILFCQGARGLVVLVRSPNTGRPRDSRKTPQINLFNVNLWSTYDVCPVLCLALGV